MNRLNLCISRDCCDILKKKYAKETGLSPYIGMLAEESDVRRQAYSVNGENNIDSNRPTSNPLMIWTDDDIWNYIHRFKLPYAKVYDMGYPRTGCIFCMYGITIDRDRFLKLKATHPKQWAYCMREREKGGLGMRQVLDYMGIPTGCEQTNLIQWEGDECQ